MTACSCSALVSNCSPVLHWHGSHRCCCELRCWEHVTWIRLADTEAVRKGASNYLCTDWWLVFQMSGSFRGGGQQCSAGASLLERGSLRKTWYLEVTREKMFVQGSAFVDHGPCGLWGETLERLWHRAVPEQLLPLQRQAPNSNSHHLWADPLCFTPSR